MHTKRRLRRTEVSCPSSPAPPKVSNVPETTGSVLVKVNAGVAYLQHIPFEEKGEGEGETYE